MLKTVTMSAAVLAMVFTGLLGVPGVPLLRKAHAAQPLKTVGPVWHQEKQGTPTLGGLLFWLGIAVGFITACLLANTSLAENGYAGGWRMAATLLGTALAFGLIGLADDCLKLIRKNNAGMSASLKIVMQVLVTAVFLAQLAVNGNLSTLVCLPGTGWVNLGAWYYILSFFLIVGMVNAVNLTDGVDGLCSGVSFVAALTFLILSMLLLEMEVPGDRFVVALFAAAVAGGCVGFLFWNFHPAKIFMGDTGSMFLGGALVAMAYGLGRPELLIPVGIVYLWEAFSVMLQVAFFKLTHGKRLFRMTPIHHSFEMRGWNEGSIVGLFCGVGVLGSLLAILAVFLNG